MNGINPIIKRISPAINTISRRSNFNDSKNFRIHKNMPELRVLVYFISKSLL